MDPCLVGLGEALPHVLLTELRGALLRLAAKRSGKHFQGLAEAGRFMRKSGVLNGKAAKAMCHIDVAYNHIRKIDAVSVRDAYTRIQDSFQAVNGPQVVPQPMTDEIPEALLEGGGVPMVQEGHKHAEVPHVQNIGCSSEAQDAPSTLHLQVPMVQEAHERAGAPHVQDVGCPSEVRVAPSVVHRQVPMVQDAQEHAEVPHVQGDGNRSEVQLVPSMLQQQVPMAQGFRKHAEAPHVQYVGIPSEVQVEPSSMHQLVPKVQEIRKHAEFPHVQSCGNPAVVPHVPKVDDQLPNPVATNYLSTVASAWAESHRRATARSSGVQHVESHAAHNVTSPMAAAWVEAHRRALAHSAPAWAEAMHRVQGEKFGKK